MTTNRKTRRPSKLTKILIRLKRGATAPVGLTYDEHVDVVAALRAVGNQDLADNLAVSLEERRIVLGLEPEGK